MFSYIAPGAKQYRANLHSHTNLSDGTLTPEQMARYKAKYHHAEILLGARGNEPVTIKVEPQPKRDPEPPQRKGPKR